MVATDALPPALLRECLSYDPTTGALTWRQRPRGHFATDHEHRRWNTRYAGRAALNGINRSGYRAGTIAGVSCLAHRVIWAMVTGVWPDGEIDHDNGIRSQNQWTNLFDRTRTGNARNRARRCDNTTGVTGVIPSPSGWTAQLGDQYLGSFASFDDAVARRRQAEREAGYNPNHGRAPHANTDGAPA